MTDQLHEQPGACTATITGVFALLKAKPGVTRTARFVKNGSGRKPSLMYEAAHGLVGVRTRKENRS